MNTKDIIESHYTEYDEDARFQKDKARRLEYLLTKYFIDKYLKPGNKILEIGAGTGKYSIHYAKQGYQVEAIELVEHNIDIFKAKITPEIPVNVVQGDALNLSIYTDSSFDITLSLGPLYHLFTEKDRKLAIREALRVTKPNGLLYIAYLTNDSIIANYFLRKKNIDTLPKMIKDNSYRLMDNPNEVFTVFHIDEFEKLVDLPNYKRLHNVAVDGIGYLLREFVDDLSEKQFKTWHDYQLAICERPDLQGYSCHMLYIGKKI
jgi:ubiquinone/menaquinone biosynthesis C-methylase UbiE